MKTILLGISGSIAAYKAPEIIRLLKKKKFRVIPILTNSASKFVSKLVLENLSGDVFFWITGTPTKLWAEASSIEERGLISVFMGR